MKTKKVLSIAACLVLLLCTAGCEKNIASDVPQPDIPMKTVTQNSLEDYVTFEFQLPEGWNSAPHGHYEFGAIAYLESALTQEIATEDSAPYKLDIGNYSSPGKKQSEEIKQMYSDLFSGNPDRYKASINQPPLKPGDGDEGSFLGLLDALIPEADSSVEPPYGEDYIGNFQYRLHKGKNGRIAEVQYSYKIEGKEYHTIECFCEKPPYKVIGTFDESLEVSSGEIALWAADSLKVTEHFILKNGKIEKKVE